MRWGELPNSLKLVGVKLEIWHASTHSYVLSENVPFSTKAILINLEIWHASTHSYVLSENVSFSTKALLLMLEFFSKKIAFSGQNSIFTQRNTVRGLLVLLPVFVR